MTLIAVLVWTFSDIWISETDAPKSDVIFCLGGGVDQSTGALGPFSLQRTQTCVRLYKQGKADNIVFSGAGPIGHSPAATLMAQRAEQLGVPAAAMFIDPNARSTLQNALNSVPLAPVAQSAILVTDSFHLPRSWVSFSWAGSPDLTLIAARPNMGTPKAPLSAMHLVRETLALWFNLIRLPLFELAQGAGMSWANKILI